MNPNVADELECEFFENGVKFSIDGVSTNLMDRDDRFTERIGKDNINPEFPIMHLKKEIQIKNTLDEGIALFKSRKYPKAIEKFDVVLFYDPEYGEALLYKSYCLRGQGHFVKALRHYRRAADADDSLKDMEYYRTLLKEANDERSNFPKLKQNIYSGDEHFAKGEYQSAIESYDRALMNPSRFKQNILSKLLNKKAAAYLKLEDYVNALKCFENSLDVDENDYAIFGEGICRHELNLEIGPKFRNCMKISKADMLSQALVLRDEGYREDSMRILNFLCENHFRNDDLYKKMADAID